MGAFSSSALTHVGATVSYHAHTLQTIVGWFYFRSPLPMLCQRQQQQLPLSGLSA
jgi:hypothetical protein